MNNNKSNSNFNVSCCIVRTLRLLRFYHQRIIARFDLCTYQYHAGGGRGGRAWGGDLIVFVGPGVGHLTDLVLPGEGVFESFFARRGDI